VQPRLQELGYYTGDISGTYDRATLAAVKAFQKKNNIKADGIAGDCDLDYCYIDYTAKIKAKGLNGYGKPPKPPEPEKKTKYVELAIDGVTYAGTLTEK
jgi:peptidoglycan hydrolase-like protein with peptidoglycan-binding domain